MKNNIVDERIELSKTSTKAEAFNLIVVFLFISILADIFIIKASWIQIIDKLSIMFLLVSYNMIANFYKSNFVSMPELKVHFIRLISMVLSAVTVTIPLSVKNYLEYGEKYSGIFDIAFIWVVVLFFIQFLIFFGILYLFLIKEDN
ncbi:DUF6773 family protein [Atopobacter phocae]|uniref:DUF6773 family protein n=1 Tax=Atopobacter phocae TaxID=136492 RepID=UPI000472182B|nr:DUF6773 family protein [Atopobacter phocae]